MYFKVSMRKNPQTNILSGYFRLVESYRNGDDRICHRTILSAGFLDDLTTDQLNLIQKILTAKVANSSNVAFEVPYSNDSSVNQHVDKFYKRICDEKRIDIEPGKQNVRKLANKDLQVIDVKLAITHLISRAVYPASELETTRWVQENSAVCEITGFDITKITKDRLYKITHKLYSLKDEIEQYLSHRTNELFDIEDKIVLYDLTNTYFEGEKRNSKLAKYGRSKEKRSDAKLVVLALVVNVEGFIKYSSILEGNIADPKTLSTMIDKLRVKTSATAKKALIVLDAGIATDSNLELIKQKGYDYLCVTRSNKKKYTVEANAPTVSVFDNKNQRIELCSVKTGNDTDYYLKVASQSKELKERSMNAQFKERFEAELKKISDSLTKKSGVKLYDKVNQRIGRAKQKYPSIQRYYTIDLECADNNVVNSMKWSIKDNIEINARSGIYFLRTSLPGASEDTVWKCYNTIREIESTFRVLKTDLDLRPIYHKKDDSTMAHLHLGLLAYWVVNTIRFQLKQKGINSDWREIVRIANTQKAVTTMAQNTDENIIVIRNCSEPTQKAKLLYDTLKYKYYPFTKKKSVVLKSKFKNYQMHEQPIFWSQ